MKVDVWDYLPEYEQEREDILAACDQVFRSGRLILGESVSRFEAAFAEYCEVRHGVGVDNGTNALVLALRAVGVQPGDEVITVSNTAAPTVVAIDQVGAVTRFVDIRHSTYLMDTDQLESAVTERTTCIVPVHLFGQCVDMDAVLRVADRHGLAVVEDCAQAHGARRSGYRAGSMSDAGAFSFYPTKVLGAYGDGGIVVTDRDDVAQRLRRLRYYGMEERYYVVQTPGHNARLDELQAEILYRKLARLGDYIARRQELAARYAELLASASGLTLPALAPGNEHVYYLYVARHAARDEILAGLAARGVNLNVSYRWPIHTMTGFAHLGYRVGDLPETEAAAGEIFSLPMYPSLSDEGQARACRMLLEVLARL